CMYDEPTAVTIKNGATVRFELTTLEGAPAPSFLLALTPQPAVAGQPASSFEIRSAADELLVSTPELVAFESQPVQQWRIPLFVERVQIGESLADSVGPAEALGT